MSRKAEEEEPFLELTEKGAEPAPVQADHKRIDARITVPLWVLFATATILYNKHLFTDLHFPFPIFLTGFHMLFATVGTNVLRYTTHLLDAVDDQPMTFDVWSKAIPPLAIMFSTSLILGNISYMRLSISFVQMLKGLSPAVVMIVQVLSGFAKPGTAQALAVAAICLGCMIASKGEIAFDLFGFLCQMAALIFDSIRLVLVQVLLQTRKMDPLVAIYYYAPVGFICIAILQPMLEGPALEAVKSIGFWTLFGNGLVAFGLNIANVYAISSAGSLVISLAGVSKDIILISASALFLGSHVAGMQVFGYSITIAAIFVYRGAESGIGPAVLHEAVGKAKGYYRHFLAGAILLAGLLTLYLCAETPIVSGLSMVSVHHDSIEVPLNNSIPLSQATMTALGNQLYAQKYDADYTVYITSDCKRDCRSQILRETIDRRRSDHVMYLGPRTTMNPSAPSVWRLFEYLSLAQPIGVLVGNRNSAVYTDYMAFDLTEEEQIHWVSHVMDDWVTQGNITDEILPWMQLDENKFRKMTHHNAKYLPVTVLDHSLAQPALKRHVVCKDCSQWLWSDVDLSDRKKLAKLAKTIKVKTWVEKGEELQKVAPMGK